jgi:hypothetical protein
MSHNPEHSRVERLRSKASAYIDAAVASGVVTKSHYNPQTQLGFTYAETPTDEELTRYSDGTVCITSNSYTYRGTAVDMIFSVLIPADGREVTMTEHITDPTQNAGEQVARSIPTEEHEYIANLILANMSDRNAESLAA